MSFFSRSKKGGVTILEWLVLMAAIAGMASIGWIGQQRYALYMAAKNTKKNLGEIEMALKSMRESGDYTPGETVIFDQFRIHLPRQKGRLWKRNEDPLGNSFGDQQIGKTPRVSRDSYLAFQSVVDDDFWEPYLIEKE